MAAASQTRRKEGFSGADVDYLDQPIETVQISRVARVKRKIVGQGGRGNHQVDSPCASWLATRVVNRRINLSISTGTARTKGDGFEIRLDMLELQLPPCPRNLVACRVWSAAQLRQRQSRDRYLGGESGGIDRAQINRD